MGVNAILNKYRAASPEEEPSGVDSILEKYKAAARRPSPQPLRGEIHFGSQDEVRPFKPELPAALKGFENKPAPGVKKSAIPSFLQPTDTLKQPKKKAPGTFSTIVEGALKEKRQGDAEIAKQAQYRRNQAREAYSKGDWKTAKKLDPEGMYPIPEKDQEREFATEGGKILPGRGIELEGQGDAYRKVFRGAQKTVGGIATALAPASVAGMTKAQKEKVAIGAGQLAQIADDVEGNLLNLVLSGVAAPVLKGLGKGIKWYRKLFNTDELKNGISLSLKEGFPPADVVKTLVKGGATEDEAIQAVGAAIRTNEASGVEFIAKAESSNAETQGLLKTLMRGGIISENRVEGGLRIPKKGDWDQVSADFPSTKRFTGQTEESALKKLQAELGKAKIVSRNEDEIVFDNGMTATVKSRFIPAKTSKDWSGGHYEYSIDVPMETGTEFQLSRKYRRFGQYMWEPTEYYPAGTKQANEPGIAETVGKTRAKQPQSNPNVIYHGTGNTESIRQKGFSYEFAGQGNDQYGPGFYFTNKPDQAKSYTTSRIDSDIPKLGGESSPGVLSGVADIKNPIRLNADIHSNVDEWPALTREQASKLINELTKTFDGDQLSNWGDVSYEGRAKVLKSMVDLYEDGSPATLIYDLAKEGAPLEDAMRLYSKLSGHDGVVITFPDGTQHTVAWFPEQIKLDEPGVAELAGKGRVVKDVQKEPWQMTREEFAQPQAYKKVSESSTAMTPANAFTGDVVRLRASLPGDIKGAGFNADEVVSRYSNKQALWEAANDLVASGRFDDGLISKLKAVKRAAEKAGARNPGKHVSIIEKALKEGKPVPAEVLADYPDLAAKYVKAEPSLSTPKTGQVEGADDLRRNYVESMVFGAETRMKPTKTGALSKAAIEQLEEAYKMEPDATRAFIEGANGLDRAKAWLKTKSTPEAVPTPLPVDDVRVNVGKPTTERLYHGTLSNFDDFEPAHFNSRTKGPKGSRDAFFFARSVDKADAYGMDATKTPTQYGRIIEADVSYSNPLRLDKSPTADDIARAKREGYDAIVTPDEVAVFNSANIRQVGEVPSPSKKVMDDAERQYEQITGKPLRSNDDQIKTEPKTAPKSNDRQINSPPPVNPVEPKTVAKAEPQKPIIVDQKNMGDVLDRLGRAIPDKDPKTVQGMVDDARATYNGEEAQRIANRAARGGVNLTDDETLKLGLRVKDLELQRDALLKRGDPADAALLDEIDRQLVEVAEAGYRSGTTWAQTGIARQIELARQAENKAASLKARAKIAIESNGGKMTDTETKQLDLLARRVETLANTLDTLKKQVQEEWRPKAQTGKRLTRAQSLGTLRRLGIPTAEAGELVGSGAGKQSGAITLPDNIFKDDKIRKAIRDLMRSYYDDGAKSIDDVLDRMRKDMPGLTDDDLYALISDKFRAQKVEANIAKLEANRFIRRTQAAASARMKPVLGRALKAVYEEVKTVQRAFQTSFDTGYALIQGHKVLATNPGKVAKSFGESLKMIPSINTQARFDRHLAEIQARPMYARAKKAGIQFADIGDGSESDFFGGGVSRKIPGIFKSEAMFDAYKNELRMSLFEAFAKNVPDDAEQMKSIAELVNVMTGTATGRAGDAVKKFGGAFYAPSYEVSKWQFMMAKPLIDAIAKHGIKSTAAKEAAKVYAKNAAVWVGGVWAAKEFNDRMKKRNPNYKGFDINTDARSADFGKLTLPNGMQFDLFGKSFSPLKDFAQLIWGTESRKGDFTPSNEFGATATKLGRYFEGKMAPLPKTLLTGLTKGTTYDFDEEKEVPISAKQMLKDSAPIGLKSIFANWKKVPEEFRPLLFLELMGVNTGQKKPQSGTPAPKMGLPPGLAKMLGPD